MRSIKQELLRRSRTSVLLLLVLLYVIVALMVVYPVTFAFIKENLVLITGGLALLILVIGFQVMFTSSVKRNIDKNEYEMFLRRETHPVLYVRVTKDVRILDEKGDATISYRMNSKNTSDGLIPQLIHEIRHDGSLKEYSASACGKQAKATFEKFVVHKINGDGEIPLSHILKIRYDLHDEKIPKGEAFTYGYDLKYDDVFSRMFEPLQEYTAHHVMEPTRLLILRISTPKGYKFAHDDNIEVKDKHEVRVEREELRCQKLYPPQFFNGDTEIMLEIEDPKMACTYALYFTVLRTNKSVS